MPSLTPQRVSLTLIQKVKIIKESKKVAFDRKKISNEFYEVYRTQKSLDLSEFFNLE